MCASEMLPLDSHVQRLRGWSELLRIDRPRAVVLSWAFVAGLAPAVVAAFEVRFFCCHDVSFHVTLSYCGGSSPDSRAFPLLS